MFESKNLNVLLELPKIGLNRTLIKNIRVDSFDPTDQESIKMDLS